MYYLNYVLYCHNGQANIGTLSTGSQLYALESGFDNPLLMLAVKSHLFLSLSDDLLLPIYMLVNSE